MSLQRLMSKVVATVSMDDRLSVVKAKLDKTGYHHFLVLNEGTLFGIISDRDFLRAISPNLGTTVETTRDLATLDKRVHQIMTRDPISLTLDNSVYDAIKLFNHANISCIPIVDHANKPIGIITWRDILKSIELKHENK